MNENKKTKDKAEEKVKVKSPKVMLIETGVKLVNRIPDIVPLLVTSALTELVKVKVRKMFD